jgi:hypothetical protein
MMYKHPVQSLYVGKFTYDSTFKYSLARDSGCFPMGFATIINASLKVHLEYGLGDRTFLYWLWGLWWLDSVIALAVYFLLLYTM